MAKLNILRFRFCPKCGSRLKKSNKGNELAICPRGDYIQHNNPKPCVAVLIAQEGKLLFGRRKIEPRKGCWDILGGFVDFGETVEEAVAREIKEETRLVVTRTDYLMSIPDIYAETGIPLLNFCFLARVKGKLRPASDIAELKWFDLKKLPPRSRMAFPHQLKLLSEFRKRLREKEIQLK